MKPTTIFIDTEFNGFGGELISMALVSEHGDQWYESLGCGEPVAWVHENVMPIINIDPIPKAHFQTSLQSWLMQFSGGIHLVADWPDDVKYFCEALITGPGYRLDTPPLTMEIRRDLDADSDVPHNALADAIAIAKKYREIEVRDAHARLSSWADVPEWATMCVMGLLVDSTVYLEHNTPGQGGKAAWTEAPFETFEFGKNHCWHQAQIIARR